MNRPRLRLVAGREGGTSSFPATTPAAYRASDPTVHRLRPAPIPAEVIARTFDEVCATHGENITLLRSCALAVVACHSRLREREAVFARAVADGRRLRRTTAPIFWQIVARLREGAPP